MCFIFWILFLTALNVSKSQLIIVEEKNFLADLLQIRKILKNPPTVENIRDKDEKRVLLQLPQEEAQPQITNDQSTSKNTPPKIVFLGKVSFFRAYAFLKLFSPRVLISPTFSKQLLCLLDESREIGRAHV
jgi:hypothetical protein